MAQKKKLRGPPRRVRAASAAAIRRVTVEAPDEPTAEARVNQEALWLGRSRREIERLLTRTAEAKLRRIAEQRARASRTGNKARRQTAMAIIDALAPQATQYRRRHPEAPLSAVMAHLRRQRDLGSSESFLEEIAPSAVSMVQLEADDLRILVGHDPTKPLGPLSAGNVQLRKDSRGLKAAVALPDVTWAADARR
jgi:prohead serine protease